jgi:hypothetical protein
LTKPTLAQIEGYGCFKTFDEKLFLTAEITSDLGITKLKYKTSNEWIILKVKIPERELKGGSCVPSEIVYNELINGKITGTYTLYKCGVNIDITYRKKGSKKSYTFSLHSDGDEMIKSKPCY